LLCAVAKVREANDEFSKELDCALKA